MSDTVERQRRREIRGSILRTLDAVYGSTVKDVSLRSILRVVGGEKREVEAELQFLVDAGYVASEQHRADALDKDAPRFYRLAANGKRVLNGDLEDASIEV